MAKASEKRALAGSIRFATIFWAVFLALWAFGISFGVAYSLLGLATH